MFTLIFYREPLGAPSDYFFGIIFGPRFVAESLPFGSWVGQDLFSCISSLSEVGGPRFVAEPPLRELGGRGFC